MNTRTAALMCASISAGACRSAAPPDEIPVACRLDALTPAERRREGELLLEHGDATQEVREVEDGYSFRYPPDASLFARMAELVTLEHRCCPFLSFQLEWRSGDAAPWLHVTASPAGKAFLRDAFAVRPAGQ